MSDNIMIRSP